MKPVNPLGGKSAKLVSIKAGDIYIDTPLGFKGLMWLEQYLLFFMCLSMRYANNRAIQHS
jgi:hypothetical protein